MIDPIELRTRLADGLLAGFVLILLELLLLILIRPIQLLFNQPGLLIYAVILLAAAVVFLERSLQNTASLQSQAWNGILGGVITWIYVEFSAWLSQVSTINTSGMLFFMLSLLVVGALWRRLAMVGLRYYFFVFLVGWGGHGLLSVVEFVSQNDPNFSFLSSAVGFIAGLAGLGAIAAVLVKNWNFYERINGSLVIWGAFTTCAFIFRALWMMG